jgi:hypothetical protein
MKKYLLGVVGCFASVMAAAADLSAIAGHYHYEQEVVTLPDGRVLQLKDMGATDAFLYISAEGTITLRMVMKAGDPMVETAKVLESNILHGKGYWIAQWPDMHGPVKAQITLAAGVLTSDTHFDDRADPDRFGSVEHAVLKLVGPDR